MAEIISRRHIETAIRYSLCFDRKGDYRGNGFSFPSDENGNIDWQKCIDKYDSNGEYIGCEFEQCAPEESSFYQSYLECTEKHPEKYDKYVGKDVHQWTEPAHAICECGKEIILENEFYGSCECPFCGQWHNIFGQCVCNPEQQVRCEDWDYEY